MKLGPIRYRRCFSGRCGECDGCTGPQSDGPSLYRTYVRVQAEQRGVTRQQIADEIEAEQRARTREIEAQLSAGRGVER